MRLRAVAKGSAVAVALWAALGGVTWLALRALDERGTLVSSPDVRALRLGILAFVLFLSSLVAAFVTGRTLLESPLAAGRAVWRPQALLLALLAPLLVCACALVVDLARSGPDRLQWAAFLGAAVVGGMAGGGLAVLRAKEDEDAFYDRAQRSNGHAATGWRT